MHRIPFPKGANYMCMVIALCNENQAMMFTDSRIVECAVNGFLVYDTYNKITKLNDTVALGFNGVLLSGERPDTPFLHSETDVITVDSACGIIQNYLKKARNAYIGLLNRTYILAGVDNDGNMCIVSITYDPNNGEVYTKKLNGKDGDRILLALPFSLEDQSSFWNERLIVLLEGFDGNAIQGKIHEFIRAIAKQSKMINTNIQHYAVTK